MTNILVECPELIASAKIGVLECLKPLEIEGKCNVQFKKTIDITVNDIRWCDVFITVRGCEYMTLQLVKAAKKVGRFIIYYLDDDLLNVPIGQACPQIYYEQVIQKNLVKVLSYSDVLWGVNDQIREKYIRFCYGKRWSINKVPMNIKKEFEQGKNEDKIRILYAGSTGHTELVQTILSPVVKKLAEDYLTKVDFTFIGADSGISTLENVHNQTIFEDYNEYRNFVEKGNFSIGLAVVKTDEFYQCKYYNKFLEYTSINCAGVYTDSKPYTYVVKDKINGVLCDNTFADWYGAIKLLIEEEELRKTCIEEARQYILEEHNINKVTKKLVEDLPELTNYNAKSFNKFQIILLPTSIYYYFSRSAELLNDRGLVRGTFSIFTHGIYYFYKKIMGIKNV